MLETALLRRRGVKTQFGDLPGDGHVVEITDVHRVCGNDGNVIVKDWREEGKAIAVVVIPLLFETQAEASFDAVVCVACCAATQQERLSARGWTTEQIELRNAAQLPVADKMFRSNHVIWTEGGLDVHAQQWERILSTG